MECEWVRIDTLKKGDRVLDLDDKECVITSIKEFDEDEMLITYWVKGGLSHLGSTVKEGKVRKVAE